jgi:hypothetical protein
MTKGFFPSKSSFGFRKCGSEVMPLGSQLMLNENDSIVF